MADIRNSNQNYTGLIPKYIGSAYDKVAAVANDIDNVSEVAASIEDGTFQYVFDNIDLIKAVMQSINDFQNIYYGIYADFPTTSPTGESIDEGDMFYHSVNQQLYIYTGTTLVDENGDTYVEDGEWIPLGAIEATTETITINYDHVQNGVVQLSHPYVPGQNNIDVYINNIIQVSTYTDPVIGSYAETSGDIITFDINKIQDGNGNVTTLAEGDDLYIVIGLNVATVDHSIDVKIGRYITEVANEQIITLPVDVDNPTGPGMTYIPNSHNLEVYVKTSQHSREIQIVKIDYLETNFDKIQFLTPLPQYAEVIFKVGIILSNLPIIPRVLMQEDKPTEIFYDEGQFWFNTGTGRMAILYKDNDALQWIDISEEHTVIHQDYIAPPSPPPVLTNATVFQPLQPDPDLFAEGTLWFNTGTGELNILYADAGDREGESGFEASAQWVKVSTQ